MIFLARGVTLALAWFLLVNFACSLFVSAAARRLGSSTTLLLAARLLPAFASLAFVGFVFAPSYLQYEPREVTEGFDVTIAALAAGAVAVIAVSLVRGAVAWRRTRSGLRAALASAEPLTLPGVPMPAFLVASETAVIALVGILRPRLILTTGVLRALAPEELDAAVAHELGHFTARDNLKRLLMRGTPDVLGWMRAARTIERRWAESAEYHADAVAAAGNRDVRLALASALVKVARIMPSAPAATCGAVSTLVGGGGVTARVERLIDDDGEVNPSRSRLWLASGMVSTAVALAVAYTPLLEAVHELTEVLVRALP